MYTAYSFVCTCMLICLDTICLCVVVMIIMMVVLDIDYLNYIIFCKDTLLLHVQKQSVGHP